MSSKNHHWGSTLDDFLQKEGIYEAVEELKAEIRKGIESGDPILLDIETIKARVIRHAGSKTTLYSARYPAVPPGRPDD